MSDDFDTILIGEPVEAMEAAKRLVKQNNPRHVGTLETMAANKALPLWSRIAAIWTLGLIDEDGVSVAALKVIAANESEDARIKDHAAEALDHIGE